MSCYLRCALLLCFSVALLACDQSSPGTPNPDLSFSAVGGPARTLVVFVHGILGNASTTFKAQSAQQGWPELLARDPAIAEPIDVISLGYASDPLQRASNINEIATRLRSKLDQEDVFIRYSRVIFVTHSMGGLVARRALLQLNQDNPDALKKVGAVFFFATPAGGSDNAELASWISKNPQFSNMSPSDVNMFLQMEDDDWAAMLRHRTQANPYPKTFCIYETRTLAISVIVPRSRSQHGCDERDIAFDRDHSSLVKPANREDEVYSYLRARLNRLIRDEYVPLAIEAYLLSGNKPLSSPAELKSGEEYQIRVKATRDSWFYVVCENSDGSIQRYFPSRLMEEQKTQQRELTLPLDSQKTFKLDNKVGVEKIHIFASGDKNDTIRRINAEIGTSPDNDRRIIYRALQLRNSLYTVKRPPQAKNGKVRIESMMGEPSVSLWIVHQ
ncbi:alpha/beta fold hydrolase [Janthinobacterium sp. PSPC2-1]|uniref:alpha/beta fold hydrolase n=1 Tax=unclassified Janthinobacterium TaxID=2610881 RepID=UPI003CE79427